MIFLPSLSIVINALIVFVSKIFKREFFITGDSFRLKLVSFSIILGISLLLGSVFLYTVKSSLDGDSNITVLTAVYKDMSSNDYLATANSAVGVLPVAKAQQNDKCLVDLKINLAPTNSIRDLLRRNGLDDSLDYRTKIAQSLNIENYRGKAEQNVQLIILLEKNDNLGRLKCGLPLINN